MKLQFSGDQSSCGDGILGDLLCEPHKMVKTVKRDQQVIRMRMRIVDDMIKQAEKDTKQAREIAVNPESLPLVFLCA